MGQENSGQPMVDPTVVSMNYGHNNEKVLIQFSKPVDNIQLTDEQIESMIQNLRMAQKMFFEFKQRRGQSGQDNTGKANGQ